MTTTPNSDFNFLLDSVLIDVQTNLAKFAGREDFYSVISQAFGDSYDQDALEGMRQQLLSRDFSALPQVEILSGDTLQGANGAYATANNTIYFSSDFLQAYSDSPEAIASVWLEEIGHSVDAQINEVDSPGDEGNLFSSLLRGVKLSTSEIQSIKNENDSVLLDLNKNSFSVEQNSEEIYSSQNPLTATDISNLYVFGTTSPDPVNYNIHIDRSNSDPTVIYYDMNDYMENSGGRYASPSLFGAVREFFKEENIEPGTYQYFYDPEEKKIRSSLSNIQELSFISENDLENFKLSISQYGTDIDSPDHADRSFIFGSTSFAITSITYQVDQVSDGLFKYIKEVVVEPTDNNSSLPGDDNFDFLSGSFFANIANSVFQPLIDPYEMGKTVYIDFLGEGQKTRSYTNFDFQRDVWTNLTTDISVIGSKTRDALDIRGIGKLLIDDGFSYLNNIASNLFLSYEKDEYNVIYGKPTDDTLSKNDFKVQKLDDDWFTGSGNILWDGIGLIIPGGKELNDVVRDAALNDKYTGYNSRYLIAGGKGIDTITGHLADDLLMGGDGSDTLYGGWGNDVIFGGSENDIIFGNGDSSTVEKTTNSRENLDTFVANIQDAYQSIDNENIVALIEQLSGNDIALNLLDLSIVGLEFLLGEDLPQAYEINQAYEDLDKISALLEFDDDTIYGGSGNDIIRGEGGNDTIHGQADNDTLIGGKGFDILSGGSGSDTAIYNFSGSVIVNLDESKAYAHNPQERASKSIDENNPANYYLDLSPAFSIGSGSADDGLGSKDQLISIENITGSAFDDILIGNGAGNNLQGFLGDDFLVGNAGKDTLNGGWGVDTVSYRWDPLGATINLSTGKATDAWGTTDTLISIENIIGSDSQESGDVIIGNNNANKITSGYGNDRIEGQGGSDWLYGEFGWDTIIGGLGEDRIYGNQGVDTIWGDSEGIDDEGDDDYIRGGDGDDIIHAGGGDDFVAGDSGYGNDQIWGGAGNDHLEGGAGEDTIWGGAGNDDIFGETENDTLYGDAGDDDIQGNLGNDDISGGLGNDDIEGNEGEDNIQGDAGDDLISGGDDNDTISGGDDNDTITGDGGDDDIQGDAGEDTINGNEGNDDISGGTDDDLIFGDAGEDNITGDDGDDRIAGGSDNDTISGGNDNDTIEGNGGNDTITGDAGADKIRGNEGDDDISGGTEDDVIFGDGGDDTITGDDGADIIQGNDGNDDISGGNDDDNISGGTGDDLIHGDAGNDNIAGNEDDDTIFGDDGNDNIQGNDGNDTIEGNLGDDNISGGAGDDDIQGNEGVDNISGGADDDTISGGTEDDLIFGDDGNDTISGDDGNDTISGGNDNDTINGNDGNDLIAGDAGSDTIHGDAGEDAISGGADNDNIFGDDGNDLIQGDGGDDNISGGNGDDTLSGNDGNDNISGDAGSDLMHGDAGDDTMSGGDGSDLMYGDEGNDTMQGDAGEDKMYGGIGDDTMGGGDGADLLFGEDGNDNMSGDAGDDSLAGGTGSDTMSGGLGDDFLNGQDGNDTLYGDEGNDTLYGEDGDDKLYGGDGDDRLIGGEGGDLLDGGAGSDIISYYTSKQGVWVMLQPGIGKRGEAAGDTIRNVENLEGSFFNDRLIGSNIDNVLIGLDGNDFLDGKVGHDTLFGNEGKDKLMGRQGDDTLHGGAGNDTLDGGSGDDSLIGAAGNDRIDGRSGDDIMSGGDGTDNIRGRSGRDTIFGGAGNDQIYAGSHDDFVQGGAGDDLIKGHSGNDVLIGGFGEDTIYAHTGKDLLIGGEDDDQLYGGRGVDTFGIGLDWGTESIYRFNIRQDRLGLFGGLTADQLSFSAGNSKNKAKKNGKSNTTLVQFAATGETLAILQGVRYRNNLSFNFEIFDDISEFTQTDSLLAIAEPEPPTELTGSEIFPSPLEPAAPEPIASVPTIDLVFPTLPDVETGDDLIGDPISTGDSGSGSTDGDDATGGTGGDSTGNNGGDDSTGDTGGDSTGNDTDPSEPPLWTNIVAGTDTKDVLIGTEAYDLLQGFDGDDILQGRDGNDVLYGGLGDDQLQGGKGNDIFALVQGEGTDRITDFSLEEDLLGLTGDLTFENLMITTGSGNNRNGTTIFAPDDELLAVISGVSANDLTASHFTQLL